MSSVNEVILIGNIGKEPELVSDKSNAVKFTLATTESYRKGNQNIEETEWHSCIAFWDNLSNFIINYVNTGDKVYIKGALKTTKHENDGHTFYYTKIIVREIKILYKKQSKNETTGSNS